MRTATRRRALGLTATAAVILIAPLAQQPARASGSWTAVASSHVPKQYERALAVVAPADDDVWAIGYKLYFVGGQPVFQTLAEHYTGGTFVSVSTPDSEIGSGRDMLTGAAASAPDDVWAVGSTIGLGFPSQTLIEHWDGTSWRIVASPNPGASGDELEAVAATSSRSAWAVGARIEKGGMYQTPLTLHWNGTRWAAIAAPNPSGCSGHSYLTSVVAPTGNTAWATGWCGSGGSTAERGYVLYWDGKTWSTVFVVPQSKAPQSETYGITGTKGNLWLVGDYQDPGSGSAKTLTYHFDGATWHFVTGPAGQGTLAGVAIGKGGTWSVGDGPSPQPPFAGPLASRYLATGWQNTPVPAPYGRLSAVTTSPSGVVWAAGTQTVNSGDDTALIVHR
ncbi:hypothetical protein [Jatrophihabitans sp.]|uniref:hypothetical protein n=1 Tax=Jatrophihabitans sp. TaxID=1932789 RepID=UPI0030C6D495|nr:hypothetical protein [Jatrophihabitans sp.]